MFDADTLALVADIPADGKTIGLVDVPGRRFAWTVWDTGEVFLGDLQDRNRLLVEGRAGVCVVGDPDQVADTLAQFVAVGCTHFCLSGYPHDEAATRFGRDVLPKLADGSMATTEPRRPSRASSAPG